MVYLRLFVVRWITGLLCVNDPEHVVIVNLPAMLDRLLGVIGYF
jgi:hypothetical protein